MAGKPAVPLLDDRLELARANRRAEQVPLRLVAMHRLEQLERAFVFDAFRARAHLELVREIDEAFDERARVFAQPHVVRELVVELHLAERHLVEMRQRRRARAEIVEAEVDVLDAQPRQDVERHGGILHRGRLRELERHHRRIEVVLADERQQTVRELEVGEELRGQIHAELHVEPVREPHARLLHRRAEHEVRDLDDEARFLGEADELLRDTASRTRDAATARAPRRLR